MRKGMDHTAFSTTQASPMTLYGATENNSKFETLKIVVNTKTRIIQMGQYISNVG